MSKVVKIVLSLVLVAALAAGGIGIYFWVAQKNKKTQIPSPMVEIKAETADETNIRHISLSWLTGSVRFYKSQDNQIKMIQKSDEKIEENQKFSYTIQDGVLSITDLADTGIKGRVPFTHLELYLPSSTYTSLTMDLTDPDVTLEGFTFDTIDVKLSSGTLSMENTGFKRGIFDNSDGQITADTPILPDYVKCKNSTGSMKFFLPDNDGIYANQSRKELDENSVVKCAFQIIKSGNKADVPYFDIDMSMGELSMWKRGSKAQ